MKNKTTPAALSYGEAVAHPWRGSLHQAIQQAMAGTAKPIEFNSGDLIAAMLRDQAGS